MRLSLTLFASAALLVVANAQVPSYVPTDGLVGWYPFNGNADDESGNGNDGTLSGANLTADRNGNANSALDFYAGNDYVEVPTTSGDFDSQDFSISFWVRTNQPPDQADPPPAFISRLSAGGANVYQNFVIFESNGNVYINGGCPWTPGYDIPSNVIMGDVWHHVVKVSTPLTTTTYVNGDLLITDTITSPQYLDFQSFPIRFGKASHPYWVDFSGELDDIAFWNRALTQQEVTALFDAQGSSPCVSATPVSFTGLGSSYDPSDAAVTLAGTPANGVFIGPGISGNTFDPATAGVGTHGITYAFVDDNGCVNTSSLCTSVEIGMGIGGGTNMTTGGVRVYPNPNRGQFNVEVDLQGLVSIQVIDTRGRLVHNEVFNGSGLKTTRVLDLSSEAKGAYTLQVQNNGGTVTQTVVVE